MNLPTILLTRNDFIEFLKDNADSTDDTYWTIKCYDVKTEEEWNKYVFKGNLENALLQAHKLKNVVILDDEWFQSCASDYLKKSSDYDMVDVCVYLVDSYLDNGTFWFVPHKLYL